MTTFDDVLAGRGGLPPCAVGGTPRVSARRRLDRAIAAALAPGAAAEIAARLAARAGAGVRALDVGCGADSPMLEAGLDAIGIDIRPEAAAAHAAARGGGAAAASATALPFADGTFDLVWSGGVLHHLDDARAAAAIAEMLRVTAPGGLIIVFDGVQPEPRWRQPVAAVIRAADRGRHMRGEAALRVLMPESRGWHHRRIRYAATGLEGLWCERHDGAA